MQSKAAIQQRKKNLIDQLCWAWKLPAVGDHREPLGFLMLSKVYVECQVFGSVFVQVLQFGEQSFVS